MMKATNLPRSGDNRIGIPGSHGAKLVRYAMWRGEEFQLGSLIDHQTRKELKTRVNPSGGDG